MSDPGSLPSGPVQTLRERVLSQPVWNVVDRRFMGGTSGRFLRDSRARLFQSYRFAGCFAPWLAELAQLCDAIALDTDDDRWTDVACALDRAACELRRLT